MPVKKKEFELDDESKIWVRQASGIEKLKISNAQAKVFRQFADKGEPADWDEDTNQEFSDALDAAGAGIEAQIEQWLAPCCLDDSFNVNLFTVEELLPILSFVRGDDEEGAVTFLSS
tara:strand:+ start:1514 stop:1864 length:351 start_codon:yes stop_codon:yes gene_type:complete